LRHREEEEEEKDDDDDNDEEEEEEEEEEEGNIYQLMVSVLTEIPTFDHELSLSAGRTAMSEEDGEGLPGRIRFYKCNNSPRKSRYGI